MPTKVHAIDIHVGHRLRERRLEAMLGLGALGQVVGVRAQQIQKYENGKDRIASSRLFLLAARRDLLQCGGGDVADAVRP